MLKLPKFLQPRQIPAEPLPTPQPNAPRTWERIGGCKLGIEDFEHVPQWVIEAVKTVPPEKKKTALDSHGYVRLQGRLWDYRISYSGEGCEACTIERAMRRDRMAPPKVA